LTTGKPKIREVTLFIYMSLDTTTERDALMIKVYPKLKEYCQSLGYDFQVVDMRWGIRDEATSDHMTSELCMKELKLCQDISAGPNFVVSSFEIFKASFKRLKDPCISLVPSGENHRKK